MLQRHRSYRRSKVKPDQDLPVCCVTISMHLAAQALISAWVSSRLRLELDEEDDLAGSTSPVAVEAAHPTAMDYSSFDGTH